MCILQVETHQVPMGEQRSRDMLTLQERQHHVSSPFQEALCSSLIGGCASCRPQGQATQTNDTTDDEQDEHGSLPIWHDVLESLPVELRQEILSLSLAHLRIDRTLVRLVAQDHPAVLTTY